MDSLSLTLFGQFHATINEQPVPGFRTRKVEALLIYLAVEPEPHRRESLMELLWPGMPDRSARHNLRQILYNLRQALPEVVAKTVTGEGDNPNKEDTAGAGSATAVPLLLANRQTIRLNPIADVEVDVTNFADLLRQVQVHGREHVDLLTCHRCRQNLEQAVALYTDDFLSDFYLDDSNPFEDWAASRRQALRRQMLDALETLTTIYARQNAYPQARTYAERQLEIDELRESGYRQLMEILALSGQREEALANYERCRQLLTEELGMAPTSRTTEIYDKIVAGDLRFDAPQEQGVRGYELKEEIGEGAYGTIYRAIQPTISRDVAVKVIRRKYANDPEFIRRFEAEAQTVARLEHPYIVPLYDYWRDPQGAYLVMRLFRGGNLLASLEHGPWEPEATVKMVDQIASALAAAHRHGIVHRDIKPANILFDQSGNAYLSDFGFAKDLRHDLQLTGDAAMVGTPDYASPEQLRNEPVTPQSDLYNLGAVLYETLTGERPFSGAPLALRIQKHLQEPLPLLRDSRPGLPAQLDDVIQQATAKRPSDRYADALAMAEAFRRAVRGDGVSPPSPEDRAVPAAVEIYNPYKGLQAFQEADADDFYGRESLIQQLVNRMAESRFMAVVGPSGSGKSSLVKAGLIPALRQGALPGSEKWFVAEMTPGTHPLEELELALLPIAVNPPPSLLEPLQKDERGLLRTIRRVLPDEAGAELLLVIDQFEELFTLVEDDVRRRHFLDSLLAALQAHHSPLRVVVTMRADFYDRPLQIQPIAELFRQHTEIVVPLSQEELTWAIQEPARRVGVGLEEGVVTAIVADVAGQAGTLPQVQYTLTELFDERQDNVMTLAAYRALGGVSGALGQRAEELYGQLDQVQQETTRQLFLRLVTLGEGVEDTRRRVRVSELEAMETAAGEVSEPSEVLDAYGRYRLLTFDRDPLTREPTVEVAHEALLREWPRLRRWLEQSRDDVRLQRRLAAAANEWERVGRDDGYLLRGSRLDLFAAWAADLDLALTQTEQDFLAASIADRAQRKAAEQARRRRELETAQQLAQTEKARAEEQGRSARRLRFFAAGLAVLAFAAFFFAQQSNQNAETAQRNAGAAATNEAQAITNADLAAANEAEALMNLNLATTREAEAISAELNAVNAQATARAEAVIRSTAEADAVEQANLARSRELASAALLNLDADPELSIFLAMQAVSQTYTSDAESALRQAIDTSRIRRSIRPPQGFPTSFVTANPDGSRLFVSGPNGATMWDTATGNLVFTHKVIDIYDYPPGTVTEEWINRAEFSPDGSLLVIPNEQWIGDNPVTGTISILNTNAYEEVITFPAHESLVQNVTFNQEGTQFASSGWDGLIKIWDIEAILSNESGQQIASLCCHDDFIWSVAYSPDGSRLVSTSDDGSVKIWNLETGTELFSLEVESRDAVFSPDGRFIVCATNSGTINFYESEQGTLYSQETGAHSRIIEQIEFSPDGALFGSGAQDRTAKIWEYADGQLEPAPLVLAGSKVEVGSITFIGDGSQVATGVFSSSQDGTVRVWDISPRNGDDFGLDAHSDRVSSIDFSPDGRQFATASHDGTAIVWNVSTEQPLFTLTGHTGRIMDIEFSPDGTLLATASTDRTAVIWDASSGDPIFTLAGHGEGVVGNLFEGILEVAFSPDGSRLATAGADMTARVWDVFTGQELMVLDGFTSGLLNVVFSPDGAYIATASDATNRNGPDDGSIKIWDAASGQELFLLPPSHEGRPWVVEFSPDGSLLVTAGSDTTAKIWLLDMQSNSGRLLATLIGHDSTVVDATFSPDGQVLATSGGEEARLWDMSIFNKIEFSTTFSDATIPELFSLPGGGGIAISPDSNTLIAGARSDGSFRSFTMNLQELLSLARSRITRTVTPDECRQYRIEPCPSDM